ncbi:MAG: tetratricopeptide repeat protein, partial [Bacteroidales bacterium]|nr:tetratricopeptide repeat protein [Bacteroidales bacterium]
ALKQNPDKEQLELLFQEAQQSLSDSVRVDMLISIYRKTIRTRPIRADILDTALNQSVKLNYKLGMAKAYNRKGLNLRYNLQYQESVDFHKLSLDYYRQTTDSLGTVKCLNSLGVSLRRLNYEREAIDYYLEALNLSRAIKSDKSIAVALNGIGNVFVNIEQYDKAMPYFREALVLEKNNKRGTNYNLSNIGETLMFQQEYDSALYYYYQALDIANELMHKDNASVIYNCIGQLYQLKGDYKKSTEYYQAAIPKLVEYDGKRYLSNTLINLGRNYIYTNQYKLAISNINRGLDLALEINSPENIILGYRTLSDYYQSQQNYDLALVNYQKTISLRDSIKGEETKRNIAALETIYENERKDSQIKKYQYDANIQKQQNTTQWLAILLLLFTVLGFILFYQVKKKNNKLVIEQMRYDIQEYIQRIEEFENKPESENEKEIFYKNVEEFGLSEREIDVLLLISQGLKNDEIAGELFLSVSTVKTHTRNIFIKLDVRNRIEAARKAQKI